MQHWFGYILLTYTPMYFRVAIKGWFKQEITRLKLRRRGAFHQATFLTLALKPIWEKERVKVLVGAPLMAALAFGGTTDLPETNEVIEPWQVSQPITNMLTADLIPPDGVTHMTYTLPVTNLTGMSQGFHQGHPGIDLRSPISTPVVAMDEGTVIFVTQERFGYGNHVEISHPRGLITRYAHLEKIQVQAGQTLSAGSIVGSIGVSGWSTGPHLHFEVYENGEVVNPLVFLYKAIELYQQENSTLKN